jgi:hypothetical protein
MRFLSIILFSLFLFGCGQPHCQIALTLKMPLTLSKGTTRFERFLSRVRHLNLRLTTKNGERLEHIFAPADWENLPLPSMEFPKNNNDTLQIEAEIWDRDQEGEPRKFAALSGKATIKAEDLNKRGGIYSEKLPMVLRTSARDYDY